MFRPANYFVLKVGAKVVEIVAVTGNADNQVAVFLRMFLCIAKRFCRHHIELNMMPVEAEIAADKVTNGQCYHNFKNLGENSDSAKFRRFEMVYFGCRLNMPSARWIGSLNRRNVQYKGLCLVARRACGDLLPKYTWQVLAAC